MYALSAAWKGIWNEERGRAERGLAACRAALIAPIEVPESEIDEATRQRLRALGYLR